MAGVPKTVRFAPEVDAEVQRLADKIGLSFNAALSVLVVEALEARGLHGGGAEAER